jgi:prefoldin subunit 5
MGQEKQRISERIERLDAEREKLSAQLNELEITERVLKRFGGKAGPTGKRGTTRPAATIAPAAGVKR